MLLPSIFKDSIFDDFMNFSFPTQSHPARGEGDWSLMRTDVTETEDGYRLDVDLPGFKKEDVKLSLDNGYLNIAATRNTDEEVKEGDKFIRRERHFGSFSRSFYVSDAMKEEDVKASFENGILHVAIPKEVQRRVEEKAYIPIAG